MRSRRAGSLGGPWGGQRGRGDKKAEEVFFFFFLHPSRRGVSAGGWGSPWGHFPGTTRAQVPSPLPRLDPCPSCPHEGSNPPQGWEAGQSGDRKRACFSCRSKMGTSRTSAYRRPWGAEGSADPTPPHVQEGDRWGRPESLHPLLWDSSLLRAQGVTRHFPCPLGSELSGESVPGPPSHSHLPPKVPGGWCHPYRNLPPTLPNLEDARLSLGTRCSLT